MRYWDGRWATLCKPGTVELPYEIVTTHAVTSEIAADLSTKLRKSGTLLLIVVARETAALREMKDVAWVSVRDRTCWVNDMAWPAQVDEPKKRNYRLWALARVMLSTATPILQGAHASQLGSSSKQPRRYLDEMLGIKQSQVSKLLSRLPTGSVARADSGWVVADFEQLWNWHATSYPGPGGIRTSWHSRRDPDKQLADIRTALAGAAAKWGHDSRRIEWLWAGPLALPRNSATVRGPQIVVSKHGTSVLPPAHYTLCDNSVATVQLVQPADPTLFLTAAAWRRPYRADPLLIDWELAHDDGNFEARAALRKWAREHARPFKID